MKYKEFLEETFLFCLNASSSLICVVGIIIYNSLGNFEFPSKLV
jgi:hypothetical protein